MYQLVNVYGLSGSGLRLTSMSSPNSWAWRVGPQHVPSIVMTPSSSCSWS